MSTPSTKPSQYYATTPYAEAFDIGYPQEPVEDQKNVYRCKYCKKITTDINGKLENHAPDCEYRLQRSGEGTQ